MIIVFPSSGHPQIESRKPIDVVKPMANKFGFREYFEESERKIKFSLDCMEKLSQILIFSLHQ